MMEAARIKPAAAAKVDPSKMSIADILAAARGKGGGAAAVAPAAPATKVTAKAAPEPVEETPADEATPVELAAEEAPAGGLKSKKDAFKSVDEILAYCRKVDAK